MMRSSARNEKPSDASTRQANAIWAAVLSFDTSKGFTFSGLPISQDSMTAPTIMMSRDTTKMTSQRGIVPAIPKVT